MRKKVSFCVFLFLVALVARTAGVLVLGINGPLENDEPEYYLPAVHLAHGEGLLKAPSQMPDGEPRPSAYRVPVPMMGLALGFLVLGEGVARARVISALIACFSAPLMYLFTRRIAPAPAAVLAGLACALYPTMIYYSLWIFSEPYFIPMLLLSLLLTTYAAESPRPRSALVAGLAWGVTTMTRPHGLPMAALVTIYLAWRSSWRHAALLALGVVAIMTPWVVRNQMVLGHPVLLATESGETFLGSNNPYVYRNPKWYGMWVYPASIPEYRERLRFIQDEVRRSAVQNAIALDYLKRNPGIIPVLAYRKLVRWLTPLTVSGGLIRLLVLGSYGGLLVLLAIGAFRGVFRNSVPLHLVFLWTFVATVVAAVYWGGLTRGRLSLEIVWIPWGAWAAWDLARLAVRALGMGRAEPTVAVGAGHR